MSGKSSHEKRDEAKTIAPKFDVQVYARESDRQMKQASIATARVSTVPSELRGGPTVPRAPRTGFDDERDVDANVTSSSVPILVAREKVSEVIALQPPSEQPRSLGVESSRAQTILLSFIDGARDLDAIIEVSGLARERVITTVRDLVRSGVVVLEQRER